MIDAHCHLYDLKDIDAVVQRAKEAKVTTMICNGAGQETNKRAVAIAEKYPEVYATVGAHPEDGFAFPHDELKKLSLHPRVVAIGECGLDYTEQTTAENKQQQIELFKQNINLARETGLPLVVHCRNAFADVFATLDYDQVQMHCFTGSMEHMRECIARGWYISFGGIITFKKSDQLRDVVQAVPAEKLLIETDSPYLTPEPLRGSQNEPANVKIVAQLVATLRQISLEEVDRITTQNSLNLFTKISTHDQNN